MTTNEELKLLLNTLIIKLDVLAEDVGKHIKDMSKWLRDNEERPEPPTPIEVSVVVTKAKAPLSIIRAFNKKDYPIFKFYHQKDVSKRIIAKRYDKVRVYPKPITGDSRKNAYQVVPGQTIQGKIVPTLPRLFLLSRFILAE